MQRCTDKHTSSLQAIKLFTLRATCLYIQNGTIYGLCVIFKIKSDCAVKHYWHNTFYIFCNGLQLCVVWERVWFYNYYVKVQQTLYRPVTGPESFQEGEAPRCQENRLMKVVRLLALHTDRLYRLVVIYVWDWVYPWATVWLEGLCQWRIPMITSGIEPATFRLLAQYLNQLLHSVCLDIMYT